MTTENTTTNTYIKYCPNVSLAKCTEKHEKGETIVLTTKYGKEVENIVHNLVLTKDGFFYYSITRADGMNYQDFCARKAEKIEGWQASANARSEKYYQKSKEHKDFLSLMEPIKVGHHSERRHRKIIQQAWDNMGKCVAESDKAAAYQGRIDYWEREASKINLSMPESIDFYQMQLIEAEQYHAFLLANPDKRPHSMSLQYSNKKVKELKDKVKTAFILWGTEEQAKEIKNKDAEEKQEKANTKLSKDERRKALMTQYGAFFAFNNDQLRDGIDKAKEAGLMQEGDKVVHLGLGMYAPKNTYKELIEKLNNRY